MCRPLTLEVDGMTDGIRLPFYFLALLGVAAQTTALRARHRVQTKSGDSSLEKSKLQAAMRKGRVSPLQANARSLLYS